MICYLHSFNPRVGINENCKYFTAALIYNNIESGYLWWIPPILMVKELDKETIYFNFRLYIGITSFSNMDEFVSVTKHIKGRESKIPIHPVRKNPKEMTANCLLTLSRRRPLSYRNQSTDLLCKSMDWFLYDNGLRLERVKSQFTHYPLVWMFCTKRSLRRISNIHEHCLRLVQ